VAAVEDHRGDAGVVWDEPRAVQYILSTAGAARIELSVLDGGGDVLDVSVSVFFFW